MVGAVERDGWQSGARRHPCTLPLAKYYSTVYTRETARCMPMYVWWRTEPLHSSCEHERMRGVRRSCSGAPEHPGAHSPSPSRPLKVAAPQIAKVTWFSLVSCEPEPVRATGDLAGRPGKFIRAAVDWRHFRRLVLASWNLPLHGAIEARSWRDRRYTVNNDSIRVDLRDVAS